MSGLVTLCLSRRAFLEAAIGFSGALLLPARGVRSGEGHRLPDAARAAIEQSPLIYVTPLRSDGRESTCQAEVWFVSEGEDLMVVTAAESWRARAVARGLDRARIWVGDFGPWKKSKGRFKTAPTFLARAERGPRSDAEAVERALKAFGAKYPDGWNKWGPRFRSGLGDGSRVLIRYRPDAL